ncbi:unnamed protein product [Malus baccata var. baccata]
MGHRYRVIYSRFMADKIPRLGGNHFMADINPADSMERRTSTERPSENQEIMISNSNKNSTAETTYQIFAGSWNVGGVSPPDYLDIQGWLRPNNIKPPANIYVLGFQEIVPLNAGNVVRSENRKVCEKWNSLIGAALNDKKNKLTEDEEEEGDFRCIISKQMVGIFISVWVSSDLCQYIRHLSVSCVGCGIMGRLGNKGSVSVRFWLHETSFCFVCSHLASGDKKSDKRRRNANVTEILSRTTFPPGPFTNLTTKILDHDRVIWLGDLNYRIYLPDATTQDLVEKQKWKLLLEYDQLKTELMEGHVFEGWHEGEINFAPSYKYYPNSGLYFGRDHKRKHKKRRAPAWCDRILWFGKGLEQNQYERVESRLSDHRPIRAIFMAEIEVLRAPEGLHSFLSDNFICLPNDFDECFCDKIFT